jgi:pyruvate dehydrogenase E1 component alpha subunit
MHIADFSIGMLGPNGIVGGDFGLAAAAALSSQILGTSRIAFCCFGEVRSTPARFNEVANIAAIWRATSRQEVYESERVILA